MADRKPLLILACGALAREITALQRASGWSQVTVQCLPAAFHNTPQRIAPAVRDWLERTAGQYRRTFVAYGDCGTGGALDRVLADYGAERIPGVHCYEFFAGPAVFAALAEAEPGTFYLTDFLTRHFERLIWRGLGLDRHPDLLPLYFGNYRRLVYLVQRPQPELVEQAQAAAARLGLAFELRLTGYGGLQRSLQDFVAEEPAWAG